MLTKKHITRQLILLAFFFSSFFGGSQTPYFQQQVNYTITVSLNDSTHSLKGLVSLNYINRSPNPLHFIYFHLWPNAYRDNTTALAKQLLNHGRTDLYFSNGLYRGFINELEFKVDEKPATYELSKEHADICKLFLEQALQPGDSVLISTPFFVKIPDSQFSRLGHTGQAYHITQWYPKPAVYDVNGWHPIPYLDQGEFYSEFGNYDVRITLPENYYLAATGNRQLAQKEEAFIKDRIKETQRLLAAKDLKDEIKNTARSSAETKTIRFLQNKVHDFAWFANKGFYILGDTITLPSTNNKVNTWVYFTGENFKAWRNALSYVNKSTLFYSGLLGDYPYRHVTAVDGTIMAGGGMEYPNITVIGSMSDTLDLEVTIAHEVGHNWFYGILASDERRYPFLDEGLNSFYEMRYLRHHYPFLKMTHYIGKDSTFGLFRLNKLPRWKDKEVAYFYSHLQRSDQALNLHSTDYSAFNYGSIVYSKAPVVFDYLMAQMGEEKFDAAMKEYYNRYSFKHPMPSDLIATLSEMGAVNLEAFNRYLVEGTDRIDYKIKRIKHTNEGYRVTVKNLTGTTLPFELGAELNGKSVFSNWKSGFKGKNTFLINVPKADKIKIDPRTIMPDVNRRNNAAKTTGLFKKGKPLQLNFVTGFGDPDKTQLNFLPAINYNVYNGFMPGILLHNYSLYRKHLQFYLLPFYGLRSKTPAGSGEVYYTIFSKKVFSQIAIGLKAKSYAYDMFNATALNKNNGTQFNDLFFNYYKISPFVELDLKNKNANSRLTQVISYNSNFLFTDSLNTSSNVISGLKLNGPVRRNTASFVQQLTYYFANKRSIDPYSFTFNLQQAGDMTKVSANFNGKYFISSNKTIVVDAFAGSFITGSNLSKAYYAFRPSGYNGSNDYLFEGGFIGRNETNGLAASQMMERDGGLRVWTILSGVPQWMASVKIKSPRVLRLPVKVYAAALFCDANLIENKVFLWDSGLQLDIGGQYLEVFIPLVYSTYIRDKLELNNIGFFNRIRFTVNLHKLVPRNLIRDNF